jgi:hypothetical protein
MASAAGSSAVRCCAAAALWISAGSGSGSEMLLTAGRICPIYAEITELQNFLKFLPANPELAENSLDQGVPRDAAEVLRELGYYCAHFHAILAVSEAGEPSVIRIRRQGLGAPAVVDLVQKVQADFGDNLLRGSLITFKTNKPTCHRLPIGGR